MSKDDPCKLAPKPASILNQILRRAGSPYRLTLSRSGSKARVLIAALEYEVPEVVGDTVEDAGGVHDVLALSLCRDLVGGLA